MSSRTRITRRQFGCTSGLVAVGLFTSLSGCTGNREAAAPTGSATTAGVALTGKKVGVALASLNHNFFLGMRQGVEEELAAQGIAGEFVVAEDSASQQQQQVDQLIAKGVDAIIMVPVDAEQAVNCVKAANAAKIPIFCIDRRVTAPGAEVACTVETDNVAMGEEAARHGLQLLCDRHGIDAGNPDAVKQLKTTVVHLWGLEAASSAQDRAKGFDRVFNPKATPNVRIIKAVGNFNAKTSQEVLGPILLGNPDVEFIFCHNDDNSVGAYNAVVDVKKGREPEQDPKRIFIVGMDGNRAAIEQIRAGNIEATVSQEPIEMGRETVKQAAKLLMGERVEAPYIAVPHHLVDRAKAGEKQGELWSDLLKSGV